MNNSDGILCSSIHFLLSYNTSLWAWPCDLLWPMEPASGRDTSHFQTACWKWDCMAWLSLVLLRSATGLYIAGEDCFCGLSPRRKCEMPTQGQPTALGRATVNPPLSCCIMEKWMFAGISRLDLGVVSYHGKSPEIGGIRYIIYFHLSAGIAAFDFFFFFCQSWEQMANPFALAPVSCSKWTFCFCFSKRTHRSPLPTPSNLMVNHQGYFVKESLRIIF